MFVLVTSYFVIFFIIFNFFCNNLCMRMFLMKRALFSIALIFAHLGIFYTTVVVFVNKTEAPSVVREGRNGLFFRS